MLYGFNLPSWHPGRAISTACSGHLALLSSKEPKLETDYSKGHFSVVSENGQQLGVIDHDEFVRNDRALLYRIDGEEVYDLNGGLVAYLDCGVASTPSGRVLFSIVRE